MGARRPDDGDDEVRRLVDDLIRDADMPELVPSEMAAAVEAGGGVAEGFELSEEELIEHAEDAGADGTRRVMEDAFGAEAEPDRGVYGEADHERSSEDDE